MKTRNHIKYQWLFRPYKDSKLKGCFIFKYKSNLMKFLNNNLEDSLNGIILLEYQTFNSFATLREYFIWYNDYKEVNEPLKIVLKKLDFRGRKYISKISNISKTSKKYFAMSNKRISLMLYIAENGITKTHAKNLVNIFYKSGFKDFISDNKNEEYINYYLKEGIDFWHWSDRCNFLRMKTIIEYFKQQNLI